MEKQAYILKVNGTKVVLSDRPTLEEAQEYVGGWVELIKIYGGAMFVDEEGRLKAYEQNKEATKEAGKEICGNAVVLKGCKTLKG